MSKDVGNMTYIYLDHAAQTFPRKAVIEVSQETLELSLGNPSSVNQLGQKGRAIVDGARISVAKHLQAQQEAIIFTSGATEAISLAIIGGYLALPKKKGVIYTSPLVHSCIWEALKFLEKNFKTEIKFLPITKTGFLDLETIGESVFSGADLIISEHGNSEIGLLQPVTKIGKKMIKWAEENDALKPLFIVDAAASMVTETISLEYLKADMIALSGEKFGGLSGSGVLLKSNSVELNPITGGSHEFGLRGGTENVVGIQALSKALELHIASQTEMRERFLKYHKLVNTFFEQKMDSFQIVTPKENFLPHIFHFILPTEKAALFVAKCDLAGLAVSAGSACSSGSIAGSKVLKNLGFSSDVAERGIRLSWGWNTTESEIKKALEVISECV